MEAKKKPAKNDKTKRNINDFGVGDRVKVNMHRGRIVDATIKAIIDRTDGKRLQVAFREGRNSVDPFVAGREKDSIGGGNYALHRVRHSDCWRKRRPQDSSRRIAGTTQPVLSMIIPCRHQRLNLASNLSNRVSWGCRAS